MSSQEKIITRKMNQAMVNNMRIRMVMIQMLQTTNTMNNLIQHIQTLQIIMMIRMQLMQITRSRVKETMIFQLLIQKI